MIDDVTLRARPGIGHDLIEDDGTIILHIPEAIAADEDVAKRLLDWFYPELERAEEDGWQLGGIRAAAKLRSTLGRAHDLLEGRQAARSERDAVEPLLAVSTGHITAETAAWIERRVAAEHDRTPGLAACPSLGVTTHGYLVRLGDDQELLAGLPADLRTAIEGVRRCHPTALWLMLDRDGPVLDGLPYYDW